LSICNQPVTHLFDLSCRHKKDASEYSFSGGS
jgi:hypothetical protein